MICTQQSYQQLRINYDTCTPERRNSCSAFESPCHEQAQPRPQSLLVLLGRQCRLDSACAKSDAVLRVSELLASESAFGGSGPDTGEKGFEWHRGTNDAIPRAGP